jgi:hypothetical protein
MEATMLNPNRNPSESADHDIEDLMCDGPEAFRLLCSRFFLARSCHEHLTSGYVEWGSVEEMEERLERLGYLRDDFARQASTIGTPNLREVLEKMELATYYAGVSDDSGGNPLPVILAGIRADLLMLNARDLEAREEWKRTREASK